MIKAAQATDISKNFALVMITIERDIIDAAKEGKVGIWYSPSKPKNIEVIQLFLDKEKDGNNVANVYLTRLGYFVNNYFGLKISWGNIPDFDGISDENDYIKIL